MAEKKPSSPKRLADKRGKLTQSQGQGNVALIITSTLLVGFIATRFFLGSNKKGKAGRVDNLSAPQNAGKVSSTGTVARSKLAKKNKRSAKASKKGAASGSQASDETCPVCKLAVQGPERVTGGEHVYHRKCFRCYQCSKELGGKGGSSFYLHGQRVYCPSCFKNFCAPRCAGCGDPCMGGQGVNASGDKTIQALNVHWHARCFRCTACGRNITGTFSERMGRPVCSGCARV